MTDILAILPKGYRTEMIFGVKTEVKIFMLSVVLGIIFGVGYELLRILRRAVTHNDAAVFIEDFIFVLICGFWYFVFVTAAAWGQIRAFILIGIIVGMVLERLVLGNIAVAAVAVIIRAFRRRIKPCGIIRIVRNAIKKGLKFVQSSKVLPNAENQEKNA